MTVLLRVDASARLNHSITRQMADRFINGWRTSESDVQIVLRDVGRQPPSIVSEASIRAGFTPPENRSQDMIDELEESMTLIDEVRRADVLVLGAPLYNYGLPASLKAWIDHPARRDILVRPSTGGLPDPKHTQRQVARRALLKGRVRLRAGRHSRWLEPPEPTPADRCDAPAGHCS